MKKAGEPNGMCAESTRCAIWRLSVGVVEVLYSIQNDWIKFPNTRNEADKMRTEFRSLHHGRLEGCVVPIYKHN